MNIGKFSLHEFSIDNEFEKKGGEALVSKAWHPRLGQVAIKRWINDVYNSNEIKLLIQNCNRPNIIKFLGILINNQSNNIGYIMPYMPNGSLEDVIHNKNEKYDEKQNSSWITQICLGLFHLHSNKIIHRDIKPSNVLLGKSRDDIKLSDFGGARSLEHITHTITKGLGTPLYMAPEIFKGEEYDFSADIYSLSITIWEILHRRCWHADASKRPTIDYVRELCSKLTFLYTDLENSVNECGTSLKNLNVHNNDESLAQISLKNPHENNLGNWSFILLIYFQEEQTILLLGGDDGMNNDSLLMLENNGQNWKQLNIKLSYAIEGHGAQFLSNNLYIFGGWNSSNGYLNWTYKLSEGLQWEKMADMNKKRSGISNSSVILNNQIWVCGGSNRKYEPLNTIEMYDSLRNKWKYMKEMNESRSSAAAAVVNGKIFCSGGWEWGDYLNSVECYDPSSDMWTILCNLPQYNVAYGAVEMNGNLIVMGGLGHYEKYYNNVWALDTTDENVVWIEKPSMPIPRTHFNIAKIHDKIFLCGGSNGSYLDSVEIFDGEVWRDGPSMPNTRIFTPAVVIPTSFARYLN